MGCTHSRSEDLRQRSSLLQSQSFVNSLEDVPGYFNQTLTAIDYLSSELPTAHSNKPEMAYNGPPSHLQNSVDVHPFWYEYGRDYHPKERFMDRSLETIPGSIPGPIPASLIPGTETAQEMRNIEIRETMASLRQQVKEVWSTRIDEDEEDGTIPSSRLPSSLPSGPSSSDVDGNMTQEEKSTLEFFESMINESQDFDTMDLSDTSRNISPVSQDIILEDDTPEADSQPWNTHEPRLTSLLPNNLGRPTAGHVHSVVSEGQRSPLGGSPHRIVPSNSNSLKKTSQSNGHAGFLQNSMYLPKQNSITSLHRNSTSSMSPTRRAPPPPTKPKPNRGSNKRYSYPMTASEPTEFGSNFLVANKPSQGSQVLLGNHQNSRLHSNGVTNGQNDGVKNIVSRFNSQQPQYSHSFTEQTGQQKRTHQEKGFRHSMYVDNNNIPSPYGHYYDSNGYNGNVNNSNEEASALPSKRRLSDGLVSTGIPGDIHKDTTNNEGALSKNSAAGVILKDTETGEDMILHDIQADLLQLQLT